MQVNVNSSELNKYLANMKKRGQVTVQKAIRRYVNKMAYITRVFAVNQTMDRAFNYKSSSTERWVKTKSKVKYVPAKRSAKVGDIRSEVGATGNISGSDVKSRGGGFLARQELGGTIKQLKTGQSGFRGSPLLRNTSEIAPKKVVKIKSSDLVKAETGRYTKSVAFAKAKRKAIQTRKKFMSTDKGVFQVARQKLYKKKTKNGREIFTRNKLKKAKLIYAFGKIGDIKVSKKPWLRPATHRAINQRQRIAKATIDYIRKELQKK